MSFLTATFLLHKMLSLISIHDSNSKSLRNSYFWHLKMSPYQLGIRGQISAKKCHVHIF